MPKPTDYNSPNNHQDQSPHGGDSWRFYMLILLKYTTIFAAFIVVCIGLILVYYARDLPDFDKVTATRQPSMTFLDNNGVVFASSGDLYGEPLDLQQMSHYIPEAVLATEDRRFYHHMGIDVFGLVRAVFVDLVAGHVVQGGSTISQQLAKNLFLTQERTLKRKIQELMMALLLEHRLTKAQILTLYLNRVYFGQGTYGVDGAARRYFNLSARNTNLYQSALIAGLLKAPSHYNPLSNPVASNERTIAVLQNMVNAGYISENQAKQAIANAPPLASQSKVVGRYFADWLRDQLVQNPTWSNEDIVIKTTLDIDIQRDVEQQLEALIKSPQGLKANVSQGAVLVITPGGAVRALIGGLDYNKSQFNRAVQAQRQPGSSFKVFLYLAAIKQGFKPSDIMEDGPITVNDWSPTNYEKGYKGLVTLQEAFAQSLNTVAVRLILRVTPSQVIAVARSLGITAPLIDQPSLALGTSDVTLLEMTGAYAAFGNGGTPVRPYGIDEITDRKGNLLYRNPDFTPAPVIAPVDLAYMQKLMSGVVNNGTGGRARFNHPAAGKTGTAQDYRDAWFLGYTADYVTGVWLGNDNPSNTMHKVTGGGLPAELWRGIMVNLHKNLSIKPLYLPPGAVLPADSDSTVTNPEKSKEDGIGNLIHVFGN